MVIGGLVPKNWGIFLKLFEIEAIMAGLLALNLLWKKHFSNKRWDLAGFVKWVQVRCNFR